MFREAAEAPAVVRTQLKTTRAILERLAASLLDLKPRAVVTCARGSSDHAATYAKYLIETRLGILTASAAPSVSSVYGVSQNLDGCLFLAISQSGQSPDLLAATRAAKSAGAFVVACVNQADSPLAELADRAVPLCAGAEHGVAATKSYIASLAALAHLVAHWASDQDLLAALEQLDRQLTEAAALDWRAALPALTEARSLFVVARGLGLGVAQEIALKCKETCGLHAEAFSAAELKHGPQALLDRKFPALLLVQDDETRALARFLAEELVARGARVLAAGLAMPGVIALPTVAGHAALEPILLAQASYRLLPALAIARGRDPDRPPHLVKVTETL
jgi:glucosamine--fructose-6-phosphate aminotransferase (isomerizing)